MRILHLLKTSVGGGWAVRMMKEHAREGVELHVALPLGGLNIPIYQELGIHVHEWNPSLRNLGESRKELRRIVEEVKPDIIHSHFVLSTLIMRLALRDSKTPRIFQVPGPLHLERWYTRWPDLWLAQKSDHWIATCGWTRTRYIKSGVKPERVIMSFYGGYMNVKDIPSGKLRSEFSIDKNDFIAGMVAYMYAPKPLLGQKRGLKGHEDFIDAIAILQKKYPDIVGVCIGGAWGDAGWYEEKVKEYASRSGARIIFTGSRTDVPELYQDFDCAVHPSHSENLGGAGESLLYAIPTVATKVGGFPDLVHEDETGYLVPPKSPEKIAEAIEKIYLDRKHAKDMALNGQRFVVENCDVKKTAAEVLDFYNHLLK